MKVRRHYVVNFDIRKFAEEHGLIMEIHRRDKSFHGTASEYYAHFEGAEVKSGRGLLGEHGNGTCESNAIHDYEKKIKGCLLVIDAMKPTRRELKCGNIAGEIEDE